MDSDYRFIQFILEGFDIVPHYRQLFDDIVAQTDPH
jgi:hypothetical protein